MARESMEQVDIPYIVVLNLDDAKRINKSAINYRPDQGLNAPVGIWQNYVKHNRNQALGKESSWTIDWPNL